MVPYYGDFAEDATVYIPFNTFTSDDPAASCTITNLVNTDIHIHKDNGTTQRNNAAGITMSVDFDSITGNHLVVIDTSDDTVAGFWIAGHDYFVRMEGTTVDEGTVNAWIGSFSIENRYNAIIDNNLDHLIQVAGTVSDASATTTDFDTALTEATNDHYNNLTIIFTGGNLAGQARRIVDYVGSSKNVTVYPALTEAPADGDAFILAATSLVYPARGASEFAYIVKDGGGNPIAGVEVWITIDEAGTKVVWNGTTDANGQPLDSEGNKPWLDSGTVYIWKQKAGYIDDDWPDTEVIS